MKTMKTLLASALGLMMVTSMMPTTLLANQTKNVTINKTNFPDDDFRELVKTFDLDQNGSFSTEELSKVKDIRDNAQDSHKNIKDLTGIEFFTDLRYLTIVNHDIKTITLDNPKLDTIWVHDNKLTSLKVTSSQLTRVFAHNNQLTSIDIPSTELKTLYVMSNKLTSLDMKNPQLNTLDCNDNELISLKVESAKLKDLSCANNHLQSLEVNNPELLGLSCDNNELTSLSIASENLRELSCKDNHLSSLDISNNPNLMGVIAYGNDIKTIDTSNNPKLELIFYFPTVNEMDVRENFDYTKIPTFDGFFDFLDEVLDEYIVRYTDLTMDRENKTISLNEGKTSGKITILLDDTYVFDEFTFYYGEKPIIPEVKPEEKPTTPEVTPEVKPETKPEAKPETKPTDTKKPTAVEDQKAPQTSDSSNVVAYMSMLLIAAATAFGVCKHREVE